MITTEDLRRYLKDGHAFRREQVVLPNCRRYGDVDSKNHILYLEMARGHGKTTIAAMETLTSALLEDRMEAFLFAGDQEQAGIALTAVRQMVQANPDIARSFRVQHNQVEVPSTGTVIKVMASDSDTAFGIGGTAKGRPVVCYEIWVWNKPALWEAIISSTGKVGDNWRVLVLSNASIEGESQMAWKGGEACRKQEDLTFYFWRSPGCIAGCL